ncbi:hypothetical protein ACFJGW_19300 [Burkholderiaceae bacterium UC74_6]
MHSIELEGRWLADPPHESKLRFLAVLAREHTIVGRNSYRPQTEELDKPGQLRNVNEVQHRVVACLAQLLNGSCAQSFQESIAGQVLVQSDPELSPLMQFAWWHTKERVAA